MKVFWGIGKVGQKLLEKENIDAIVDSDMDKVGTIWGEVKVYDTSLVEKLSEEDVIYITTKIYQYQEEIYEIIKALNPKVKIKCYKEIVFRELPSLKEANEYYESADRERIQQWVNSAILTEAPFWDKKISNIVEDYRLHEREFIYSPIEYKESDIILDVGCGALPKFGNMVNGKKIDYIPVDPLAYQYHFSRERYGYDVPVRPKFAIMENLTDSFMENSVDYIIVHNAMDHSIDILRAFIECLRVLKVGGKLLLEHFEAECLWELFDGLHQWGFTTMDENLLIIGHDSMLVNITRIFKDICEIKIERDIYERKQDVIKVQMRKISKIPEELIQKYDDCKFRGVLIEELFSKLTIEAYESEKGCVL